MHVILDIDGTLGTADHRIHHLNKPGGADWENFLAPELVKLDLPIPAAQRVVRKMQELRYNLVFITGRNEALREVTSTWLFQHFNVVTDDYNLLMRPLSNMLRASEYKAQQMQNVLADYKSRGDASFLFIDDDPFVFPVYGAEGIVLKAPGCWEHMFPDNSDDAQELIWRP